MFKIEYANGIIITMIATSVIFEKRMGELGLMGVAVPERGAGEAAAAPPSPPALGEPPGAGGSHAVIMSVNNSLYCDPLLKHGDDAQRERFLKPVASGLAPGRVARPPSGRGP